MLDLEWLHRKNFSGFYSIVHHAMKITYLPIVWLGNAKGGTIILDITLA